MNEKPPVAPSNVEQLRAWDGDQGAFWTAWAERFSEGVARYHGRFLEAAAIEAGEAVLDIGCGSGQTTRDAARSAGDGPVLGVDLSSRMIALGRRLAAEDRLDNVTFRQADAQVYPFAEGQFDVAISRNGAMFFGDAPAAFANIARALRRGGRLVLLSWQAFERNEWITTFRTILAEGRELPSPLPDTPGSLRDPDQVRGLLAGAGFENVELTPLSEPIYFGRDVDDAYAFVSEQFAWLTAPLDDDTRAAALAALRADLAAHETDRGVRYDSAAWLIEARRG